MRLGVVITDAQYGGVATTFIEAAGRRGWDTRCFLTDTGVRAIEDAQFVAAVRAAGTNLALCELSAERYPGVDAAANAMGDAIIIGGQYQDAELVHNSDRVLVF